MASAEFRIIERRAEFGVACSDTVGVVATDEVDGGLVNDDAAIARVGASDDLAQEFLFGVKWGWHGLFFEERFKATDEGDVEEKEYDVTGYWVSVNELADLT